MNKLEITHKRVCKFYKDNPSINFEAVNVIFVDLLEKLLCDTNSILTTMPNINELQQSVLSLKDTISHMNSDTITSILNKLSDSKKEYIDDLRNIIQTNTYDKIAPLLEKNNSILIDKTNLIMSDVIPRNQNQIHSQISDTLSGFYKSMNDDTKTLLKMVDTNSIKEFINNFEMKSSLMLQGVQQPIYAFIAASEDRINANITASTNVQHKFMTDMTDMMINFKDGKHAQQQTQRNLDNDLLSIFTKIYNSAEIAVQHTESSSIISLKRLRKPTIMVEHKNCEENVGVDDVNAFFELIDEKKCNGIFISQRSGISTKKNYQIEVHNNNIVVFVHNANYCPTKIEGAVNIIDHMNAQIRQFKGPQENDLSIPKDVLDSINNEYHLFITQKNAVAEILKESQKKILSQVDEIRFPSLDKFLSTKYSAPIQKTGLKCSICKGFSANNLKALAAHKRGCLRKNPVTISVSSQNQNANPNINNTITTNQNMAQNLIQTL